jgi:hypothetical protein
VHASVILSDFRLYEDPCDHDETSLNTQISLSLPIIRFRVSHIDCDTNDIYLSLYFLLRSDRILCIIRTFLLYPERMVKRE